MLSTQQVFESINNAINTKSPFSLIRVGDGETVLLNSLGNLERLTKQITNQLGYMPNPDEIKEIRSNLIDSIHASDILGVPYGQYLISKNIYWRNGLQIINENCSLQPYQDFCSMNIHRDFLREGYLDRLLLDREEIFYISAHNLDALKQKYNIGNVNGFIIPPEVKYFTNTTGKVHYPQVYTEVINWISNIDCAGKIILVGAGIVGKGYLKAIKDKGGIAFDIGSVCDLLIGRATRGKDKKNFYDNTFKLVQ